VPVFHNITAISFFPEAHLARSTIARIRFLTFGWLCACSGSVLIVYSVRIRSTNGSNNKRAKCGTNKQNLFHQFFQGIWTTKNILVTSKINVRWTIRKNTGLVSWNLNVWILSGADVRGLPESCLVLVLTDTERICASVILHDLPSANWLYRFHLKCMSIVVGQNSF